MAEEKDCASQPMANDDKMHEYEIDDAVRTLLRAEEIKGNKKLLTAVLEKLGKQKKAISSLQDLRDLNTKANEPKDEAEEAEEDEEV